MTTVRRVSTVGTTYCVLSAVVYAVFYTFQGYVSKSQDPMWINCVQAAMAALLIGAFMVWQSANGRRVFPTWQNALKLAALGLIGQVGGVLLVWAMSQVGAGISTVIGTAIMLASSAILGLFLLGERVSWQQIAAMTLITVSVVCFSLNSEAAPNAEVAPVLYLAGIAAAGISGVIFALLTVGIRKMVTGTTSAEATVFFLNVMGPLALGPLCLHQLGFDKLMHTSPRDMGIMIASGPFNLVGLLLVTKSLQLINVVRVNVINNGLCTTLVVIAGICLLHDPHGFVIIVGMLLSIAGILLISLADPNQGEVHEDHAPGIPAS
jgi:drug/metabolite transporter (DMT)-like permease